MVRKMGVLVAAFFIISCLNGGRVARAADLVEMEVAVFTPPSLGAFLPPTITKIKTDEKNGLKIKWSWKPPDPYNAGYYSGQFKIGASGALASEAIRRVKGHKTVYLFNTFGYFGTILTNNPMIKTLKDLEGKKMAASKVTTNYAMFLYFAKKEGVDMNKVEVPSADTSTQMTLLQSKQIDAIQLWEPAFTMAMFNNPGKFSPVYYHRKLKEYTGMAWAPYLGVAAHESWAKANPELVGRLYRSFKDAEEWIWAHKDEAAKIIGEECKIPEGAMKELLGDNDRLSLNVQPAEKIEKEIYDVFEMMKWQGYIDQLPDKGIIYRGLK